MMLVAADVVLLVGAFALFDTLRTPQRDVLIGLTPAFLLLPLFQTIAFYNGTYSRDGLTDWRAASIRAITALLISVMLLNFFAFMGKSNAQFSRWVFVWSTVAWAVGMVLVRLVMARLLVREWGPSMTNRLLIEAGGPPVRIPHLYRINAQEHGLEPSLGEPVMLDRLSRYFRNMDQVIVSCRAQDHSAWASVLKGSGLHGELISDHALEVGAIGLVHHEQAGLTGLVVSRGQLGFRARVMKRAFDVAVALTALTLFSPVLALAALAIKLEDGGPVLFRQRRVGRGNTFFDICKFRSMCEAAADPDGAQSASRADARTTRVGRFIRKTSIDELPQLFNVLMGDMSIVGPRPHALGSQAGDKWFWEVDARYWQRHSLRPGITGLAQVRGLRGATDTEQDLTNRLQSDMEYLGSWSLLGDIRIVLRTIAVLVHDRAY
jgi:polysaccharide biosynthesis protein PslA